MKHAQVGLIPFHVTEMIHSVHPIKLYEYMACGLPVIAVCWEELESLQSPALLCRTRTDFVRAIPQALENGASSRERLMAFAAQADWRNRFALIARR